MLKISKLADYATVILVNIANSHGPSTAKNIANDTKINHPTTQKILKLLANNHLLVSHLGSKGGYSLGSPAADITLLHIIEAVEGGIALTDCVTSSNACSINSCCPVHGHWQIITKIVQSALQEVTLADLMQQHNKLPLQVGTMTIKEITT